MFDYQDKQIILAGENHNHIAFSKGERDLIKEYKPPFVLHEKASAKDPDYFEHKTEKYSEYRMFQDIQGKVDREERKYLGKALKTATIKRNRKKFAQELPIVDWPDTTQEKFISAIEKMDIEDPSYELEWLVRKLERLFEKIERRRKIYYLIDGVSYVRKEGHKSYIAGNDVENSKKKANSVKEKAKIFKKLEEKRNNVMAEKTAHYRDKADIDRPILSIVGLGHLEPVSQKLESANYDVKAINLEEELDPKRI